MRIIAGGILLMATSFILASCGSSPETPDAAESPPATRTADAVTADNAGRPAVFGQCAACHQVSPGRNGVGPSMAGIVGQKAGTRPGFAYSAALQDSGIVWDDASLDEWLKSPRSLVPGTKMSFAGMPDPAKRQQIVTYLKTLK